MFEIHTSINLKKSK